jgi:hypothetical protein
MPPHIKDCPSKFVDNGEWRDRADLNGPLMRLAFPDVHIVKSDVWRDWIKTGGTIVFERSVTVNRVSAHKSYVYSYRITRTGG